MLVLELSDNAKTIALNALESRTADRIHRFDPMPLVNLNWPFSSRNSWDYENSIVLNALEWCLDVSELGLNLFKFSKR